MIVSTQELFKMAYGKYAIGAYNINNLEQTMGLFRGCIDSKAPFIIQLSKGARSYTDKEMLEGVIRSAEKVFPEAIFAVHLDHGDEQICSWPMTPAQPGSEPTTTLGSLQTQVFKEYCDENPTARACSSYLMDIVNLSFIDQLLAPLKTVLPSVTPAARAPADSA